MAHRVRVASLLLALAACGGSAKKPAPAAPPTIVTGEDSIEIYDPITFAADADLAPTSDQTLDAIVTTLQGHPEIVMVEIQVHDPDQSLADRRADAVVAYLVGKGIDSERLKPIGLTEPAADPKSPVAFMIIHPDE